jgi:predicted SAM-dependent methyltransferase
MNVKVFHRSSRSFWEHFKKANNMRKQVRKALPNLRIVVGSAGIFDEGWIPTDIDTLDLLKKSDWGCLFKQGEIRAILAEHVWEHLSIEDGERAAFNCYKYLRAGGYLRIAVPDGFHPDPEYIDYVRVGGSGCGAGDHKVLYNYILLKEMLEKIGFQVHLLEYFDERGQFHYDEWKPADGKIHRSKRFDERNANGELKYTSLIIDAIKPVRRKGNPK